MRIRTHANPLSCTMRFDRLEPRKIFPTFKGELDLEIGFGRSLFLKKYATDNPGRFVVGVEVRKKAVEEMQEIIIEQKLENVYLTHGNGSVCLNDMFLDNSLDKIFVFHPDPWIKTKHLKRRLVNDEFLSIVQKKLKNGGRVYISTDVEFLWKEIIKAFDVNYNFEQIEDSDFWQNYYSGRWNEISKEKGRKVFFSTFCLSV